jgi:hypothetical protein
MQSHLSQERRYASPSFRGQHGPDRRRQIAHRGIQANAPGRIALRTRFSAIRPASSIYERRPQWDIEQLFRTLKSQGLDLEDSFLSDGDALECLAATALMAACSVMQLVQGRGEAGSALPASRVFSPAEISLIEALTRKFEGKTEKQKNPHPKQSLAWAAWCIARAGGWNGYASERPPGPITFARGFRRFHAIAEGFALAANNRYEPH